MPERSLHQQWADQQIATLVELGIDIADAERQVKWVLDNLPEGEDPATYIFPDGALWQDPASDESVQDARVNWYTAEHVQPKYKRLLDARAEEEGE